MALSCSRQAFTAGEGCPSLDVDTSFPDFGACESADTSRLRSPARNNLQKTPAFNIFMPAVDPLPFIFPDVDLDTDCAIPDNIYTHVSISPKPFTGGGGSSSGKLDLLSSPGSCSLSGMSLALNIPVAVGGVFRGSTPISTQSYGNVYKLYAGAEDSGSRTVSIGVPVYSAISGAGIVVLG